MRKARRTAPGTSPAGATALAEPARKGGIMTQLSIAAILILALPIVAPAQSQIDLPAETVVAVIDGAPITLGEVSAAAVMLDAKRLFSLNQQLYAVRERALSQMIGERLLAQEARDAGQ